MEKMKKTDDIISNDTYLLLKQIGFECDRKIDVARLVVLLEHKYPNCILTSVEGTHLPIFREDLFDEAAKLYQDDFWANRDYMVRLAIKEIIEKEDFIDGLSKQQRKEVFNKVYKDCKHDQGLVTGGLGPSTCKICGKPMM